MAYNETKTIRSVSVSSIDIAKLSVKAPKHSRMEDKQKLLLKQQKDLFRTFCCILLTYLKSKDPEVYQKGRAVVKDCKARHVRGEKGYESVTVSMKMRLKEVVGEDYWKRAEQHMIRRHEKQRVSKVMTLQQPVL